mgnify:CR=1 FL=1
MAQAITVTDIRKNFGAVEALKGVSLDVAEGEKVVVIGPSGSGKSTLLRAINRLIPISAGTVSLEVGAETEDGLYYYTKLENSKAVNLMLKASVDEILSALQF